MAACGWGCNSGPCNSYLLCGRLELVPQAASWDVVRLGCCVGFPDVCCCIGEVVVVGRQADIVVVMLPAVVVGSMLGRTVVWGSVVVDTEAAVVGRDGLVERSLESAGRVGAVVIVVYVAG